MGATAVNPQCDGGLKVALGCTGEQTSECPVWSSSPWPHSRGDMEPSQGRKEARGEDLNSLVHHLAGSNLNDLDSQLPTPFAQCGDCDEREASGASSSACTAGSRSLRDRFCKNARQGSSSSSLSAQDSQKSIAGSASSSFSLPDYLRSNWSGSSSSMLGSRQNNSGGSGLLHSTSGERFRKDSAELSGSAHSNSRVNGRLRSAHTDDVTSSWDLGRISGLQPPLLLGL